MVFCNKMHLEPMSDDDNSNNPYFNRWFSAIKNIEELINSIYCHNPYFNRWFSAIMVYFML